MDNRRTRPAARQAVAALRPDALQRPQLERFVPSGRSLAAGVALLLGGVVAFVVARQTSLFAIRAVEVQGAPPALERQVRAVLSPLVGQSLVALDGEAVRERLATLREVRGARYDRSFPHTLRVSVRPDRPVAVLRSGTRAWLVSAHGAVLRPLTRRPYPRYPRVWVARREAPTANVPVAPERVAAALRGLADARRARTSLRTAVKAVRAQAGELTFVLRSGVELRLGEPVDVALKLAVAARVLRALPADEREHVRYVDLTAPGRPVTGTNPQL